MKNWNNVSGIPRFFSLRSYPPHRITFLLMLASSLIIAAVEFYLQGEPVVDSLGETALIFLASFLTWALTRELDPDRVIRAYLAQSLLIPVWLFFGPLPLLPSSIVLLSSRYLSRISGVRWTFWDRLLLLIAAIGFMLYFQNPVFGFFGGLIFAVDAYLNHKIKNNTLFSAIAITLSLAYTFLVWHAKSSNPSSGELLILGLVAILSILRISRLKTVKSLTDQNEMLIQPKRLKAAILLALLLPLFSIGFFGGVSNQFTLLFIVLLMTVP